MTDSPEQPGFAPVPTRRRHDGWTPERQLAFIAALAESACVEEACRAVGVSSTAAYKLRARPDAQPFRLAWDNALDYAIRRLSDAVISRALHGEAVPHYYKGELVGEHRRYDNRLAQFLLRYRDPLRYARAADHMSYTGTPERAAEALQLAALRLLDPATGCAPADPPEEGPPWSLTVRPNYAQQAADYGAWLELREDGEGHAP